MSEPRFDSLAFDEIPRPHFADVIVRPLPPGVTLDPAEWADAIFSPEGAPRWVRAAFILREALVPLIGVPRGSPDTFTVARVEGEEAVIVAPDTHLFFCCAVGVDPRRRLVRVTTTVRLHGWRGRLYFAPVKLVHPVVVQSMLRRASRTLHRRARAR
ncbi:hypothetical protein GCM10022198_03560 [Klugiella xanthotipulae]|uniref:Uncharacterized protein DUF2867 n=1 Tax=Klugiella xanthotipulae TaxID=244735 RepID=A0A543I6Y9_9MICO|nr:DUF2867 domain-containing protein [Klugiella xanthotipulae]TQM66347.1 uncharacterized protein DUF2867 [Klugiella xanthotipulae]